MSGRGVRLHRVTGLLLCGLFFALACGRAAADRVIDAAQAGIVGDAETVNTAAIQRLIDRCSAAGGGTIRFGSGRYLTGTIEIRSNVTLRLDAGAAIVGSAAASDYRNLDPFIDGSGNPMGHALIVGLDADNVGIVGEGTIDGRSPQLKARQHPYRMRPFLLRWVRCRNVTVRGIHLVNPGSWTLNCYRTKRAVIEGVTIRSRGLGMPNNDGINLDGCENFRIRHCDVVSGDDALVIKATSATAPSRDIDAADCRLSSNTNAIKLGTESIGGFEHIRVSRCRISDTRMAGIALYEVDGGDLRDVVISDVAMDGVTLPISVRLGARLKTFRAGERPRAGPGALGDVVLRNVEAKRVGRIGLLINGLRGHPVGPLALQNIRIELPGGGTGAEAKIVLPEAEAAYPEINMFGSRMPAYAIYARHVRGVSFQDVHTTLLHPDARPRAVLIDGQN